MNWILKIVLLNLLLVVPGIIADTQKTEGISYKQVINYIDRHNLSIVAGNLYIKEKNALMNQAGNWYNPNIEIELENFGGNLEGGGETEELTVTFSQLFQLGGKHAKNKHIARLNLDLSQIHADKLRLNVMKIAGKRFLALLVTRDLEKQAFDFYKLTEKIHNLIKAQVAVGKISPLKLKKTEIMTAEALIELNKSKKLKQIAYDELILLWQNQELINNPEISDSSFRTVTGSLSKRYSIPSKQELLKYVRNNPHTREFKKNRLLNEMKLERQKAEVIPNLELSGGFKKYRDIQGHNLTVAIGIQLPLFDWNRGNINAARYRMEKSIIQEKDSMNRLFNQFNKLYRLWASAKEEIRIIEINALVPSRHLYEKILEGYKAGKFSFLEVLDARQTMNNTKQKYIKSLYKFHFTALEIAYMAGTTLDKLVTEGKPF